MPRCVITMENIVNILGVSAQKTGSRRNCCVVGCSDTEQKNPGLQFYSFPRHSWQKQRKEVSLAAERRLAERKKYLYVISP